MSNVPKLVWEMRKAARWHPLNALLLKNDANRVILTLKSLGIENLPERWESTGAYAKAARTFRQVVGKNWYGEKHGTVSPYIGPILTGPANGTYIHD